MKKTLTGLLMFFVAFLSMSAFAVEMTLENLSADQDDPYSELGYSIVAPNAHLHGTFNTSNFTNAAQQAADTSGVRFTKNDAGKFDFISLEAVNVLGLDATSGSFALQIDGIVNGATKVSKQLTTGTSGLVNFLSENELWTGLDEVQFWFESQPTGFGSFSTFSGDDFKFDNINVEATTSVVPVPAAVWFFVSGLAGLGYLRKKQPVV